jgi:hypothetical protein
MYDVGMTKGALTRGSPPDRLGGRSTREVLMDLEPHLPRWRDRPQDGRKDHEALLYDAPDVTTTEEQVGQLSQPTPSPSPSNPCGSDPTTVKLLPLMSPQSKSGDGGGMQKSG